MLFLFTYLFFLSNLITKVPSCGSYINSGKISSLDSIDVVSSFVYEESQSTTCSSNLSSKNE